jgi:hypothetical protein
MLANTRRLVQAEGAWIEKIEPVKGHYQLTIRLDDGRKLSLMMSGSPKNAHYTPMNVAQDVRRFKRGVYK